MKLVKLLSSLGYGSQKEVRLLVNTGRVASAAGLRWGVEANVEHGDVLVDDIPLDPPSGTVVMLNKPCGFTCSTADPGRIVYELLPPCFLRRKPIISPVGRLDRDTSGLLLLTDDGQFLHRVISPRSTIPKTYQVTLTQPLRGDEAEVFASGSLLLRSETTALAPARLQVHDARSAAITITEGRYHQVRRMFAALDNRVETLHRSRLGGLALGGLEPGQWRVLAPDEIAAALSTG